MKRLELVVNLMLAMLLFFNVVANVVIYLFPDPKVQELEQRIFALETQLRPGIVPVEKKQSQRPSKSLGSEAPTGK